MYIYLQRIFSFFETPESKNKIHAFDTTVVRGGGPLQKTQQKNRTLTEHYQLI